MVFKYSYLILIICKQLYGWFYGMSFPVGLFYVEVNNYGLQLYTV